MSSTESLLHVCPTLHGFYECRYVADDCSRFFANLLYPDRMPLGFFTISSPGEPVTLSPATLALHHLSKNPLFDAKPSFSEAVTLSPPRLFFVNRPFGPPRSQILNVTASNISLSVKQSNGTDRQNP